MNEKGGFFFFLKMVIKSILHESSDKWFIVRPTCFADSVKSFDNVTSVLTNACSQSKNAII